MSTAAVARREFSGLSQRYLVAAAASETVLTSDAFFGPYESNMLQVLREHGVDVFNEDMEPYREDQAIIDDLLAEEEFQKQRRQRQARRPKSYNTILHDMVLWHFVHRKRPKSVDSPLDLVFWAVTEDFGLISFDKHRRRSATDFPIFLTPAALMQLLQFWVPRTEQLDRALVGALRLPFLFQDFDKSAERVTTRILRALSRYENVGDLSLPVITGVLTNQALRSRLGDGKDEVEEDIALREALVEEAARAERARARLAEELEEIRGESERQRIAQEEERVRAEVTEQGLRDDLERAKAKQEEQLASMEDEVVRVKGDEQALADQVELLKANMKRQSSLRRFVVVAALLLVPMGLAGWMCYLLLGLTPFPTWVRVAGAVTFGLGAWMLLTPLLTRDDYVRATRIGRLLTWSGNSLLRLLGVLVIGVVSGLLVELFMQT